MAAEQRPFDTEADQYNKINSLTTRVGELTGAVEQSNKHIGQLIELLKKALFYMFLIICFLIAAVVYGALGEKGFNAVAKKVAMSRTPVISWHGDQDKYMKG